MTTERKNKLLVFIDTEILRVTDSAQKVKVTLSHSLSGYSIAGDMFHAQNAKGMVDEYLERLKNLKKEITGALDQVAKKIVPVSFVQVKYADGNILDFYFVKDAVSLPGYLLISKDSPVGKGVFGKKSGDTFSYVIEQEGIKKTFRGKIISVE